MPWANIRDTLATRGLTGQGRSLSSALKNQLFTYGYMKENTILLLPGLGNSGTDHWQTHWEREFGYERLFQNDWDTPCVQDWVERLQTRIVADDTPKILVAHSLACCLVAHWAQVHRGPVAGALLVAPSDVEGPNYPSGTVEFAPMPLNVLPFPTMVVASTDDEYVPLARGRHFAQAWGSDYRLIGPRGHIGSATKLGLWQEGQTLLADLQVQLPISARQKTKKSL